MLAVRRSTVLGTLAWLTPRLRSSADGSRITRKMAPIEPRSGASRGWSGSGSGGRSRLHGPTRRSRCPVSAGSRRHYASAAVLLGLASVPCYGVTDYLARVAGCAASLWCIMFYAELVSLMLLSAWAAVAHVSTPTAFAVLWGPLQNRGATGWGEVEIASYPSRLEPEGYQWTTSNIHISRQESAS